MIRYMQGDILQAEAEALVNTVNCVGVMGQGIALQFKKAFPDNYKAYREACRRGEVRPGRMFVYKTTGLAQPRYIINFPTKRHWRGRSRLEDIEAGLAALVDEIRSRNIRSVALPPLGCGLGGLNWNQVRPRIEHALEALPDIDVQLFEPGYQSQSYNSHTLDRIPKMTPGRAALIGLANSYLRALLDPEITLLEIHKLMYFLQASGEPLRLRFVKAPYGPYAENLRHVLRVIEGYFISGYEDGDDAPYKHLVVKPEAVQRAEDYLKEYPETQERVERVVRLVEGFETPFGLELLSTIHWLMTEEGIRQSDNLVRAVHEWAPRKRQFTVAQIELGLERLALEGWI